MTESELREVLRLHALWLEHPYEDSKRANLQNANLRRAFLSEVDLRQTSLQKADLQEADLRRANLQEADLRGAKLRWTDLQYADLRKADLSLANLQRANLHKANLKGVKTSYKNNWARTFFLHGACKEACQWVEEQNLKDLAELVERCPNSTWVEWLEENGFWLGE